MSDEEQPIEEWGEEPAAPAPAQPESHPGLVSRIRWGLLSFIVLAIIVIILSAQNTQEVELKALGWTAQAPLVVIILVTVLVTVVLDELVGVILRARKKKRIAEKEELKRLRRNAS
jgi:uncharacterized integral membrane protein